MITVAQVLGLDGLGLRMVVEGDTGAPVSWVATSELADPTPYLNGGEIVLFTGLNSPVDRPSWGRYARRLAEKGVVALGMGVGRSLSHPEVPEHLVEAARDAGLTLFSVPEETPFLELIQAVAEMRAAQERTALESMLTMQRTLTRAATGADGSTRVLESLAGLIEGGWAAICTADAEITHRSGPAVPELPTGRSLEELVDRLRPARLRGSLSESGPAGSIVIHPLGVQGVPLTYLVVVTPRPVERAQAGAITTAVALLSLHAERAGERALFRRRVRAGALALVLGGDVRSGDALLAVAEDGGWAGSSRRVRVVRLRGDAEPVREAARRIEGYADRTGHRALVGAAAQDGPGEVDVTVLLQDDAELLRALREVVERSGARAGIGGAAPVEAAGTSEHQALDVLGRTTARHRVGVWDDLVAGGFAGLLPPEAARAFARDLLAPVRAREGGDQLLGLLRTFLAHNGNRRQAAAELGIHRNTMLQRLQTVEQALGRSLDDPQLRADLWIALRVHAG
ncbi:PucR family transcriptional regulator [Kocuria sediminis]|uniref:PucR family transcriptional regulator n=1 Tax=Kocuria sediminis TaxID=1038857 RepID=A0A6N8GHT1_9MICC|nr:PucR family transcriptional regulator [Kocuria sediminis]